MRLVNASHNERSETASRLFRPAPRSASDEEHKNSRGLFFAPRSERKEARIFALNVKVEACISIALNENLVILYFFCHGLDFQGRIFALKRRINKVH